MDFIISFVIIPCTLYLTEMWSHSGEQVNMLGPCFPVKGMSYERMLYAHIFI